MGQPGLKVRVRSSALDESGELMGEAGAYESGLFALRGAEGVSVAAKGEDELIPLEAIDEVRVEQNEDLEWLLVLDLVEEEKGGRLLEVRIAAEGAGQAEPLALKAAIEVLLEEHTEIEEEHEQAPAEVAAAGVDGSTSGDDGELQFDRVEYDGEDGQPALTAGNCGTCQRSFDEVYFDVNGAACCPECVKVLEAYREQHGPGGRFLRALLFGTLAAAAGAGLYYGIVMLTGWEIGLVAIAVGVMVGAAVKAGSQRRGGPGYQALAMILTYLAICTTYMQMIDSGFKQVAVEGRAKRVASLERSLVEPGKSSEELAMLRAKLALANKEKPTERSLVGWLFLAGIALVWPVLSIIASGVSQIMGLVILAFGVYMAWRMCKREPFEVSGPFEIATGAESS